MKFDPLHDYSNTDLSAEDNLILWKFGELIKTLVTLAAAPGRQAEINGFGVIADDVLNDFDSYFKLSHTSYIIHKLLTPEQYTLLDELDQFLESQNNSSPELWENEALYTHPFWETVRQKAAAILEMMGMEDIDIAWERKEEQGQQLLVQSTRTRLVRRS